MWSLRIEFMQFQALHYSLYNFPWWSFCPVSAHDVSQAVMSVTEEIEGHSSAEEFSSSQLWCTASFVVWVSTANIFYHEIEIKEKRLNREIHCLAKGNVPFACQLGNTAELLKVDPSQIKSIKSSLNIFMCFASVLYKLLIFCIGLTYIQPDIDKIHLLPSLWRKICDWKIPWSVSFLPSLVFLWEFNSILLFPEDFSLILFFLFCFWHHLPRKYKV